MTLPVPTPRPLPAKAIVALLLCGVALWAWVDRGDIGSPHTLWVAGGGVAVVVAVPRLRRAVATAATGDATVPRFRTTVIVAVLAAAYFAASAWWQGRDLGPHAHDDFAYLIQARQVAGGRLWSHLSPGVADFFDSPYLIVRPVYAVQYWPGTALAYAAGARVGWPPWWTAAALAGATVAAFFHLLRELPFPPAAAAVGAVLLAAGRPFHTISVTVNAHVPVLLGGLIAAVAAVRWMRGGGLPWAAVGGAAAGWAAVCRPVDAVCLVAPVAVAAVVVRRVGLLKAAAVAVVAASPFVALQLAFDRGVTGRWLDSPFAFYYRRDYPQVAYGFPPYDPAARPASVVPQKRDLYEQFAVPFVRTHQPGRWLRDWAAVRLPGTFAGGQPAPLLLVLVPLGVAAVVVDRRWSAAVVGSAALFPLLYAPYTIFLPTYAVLCGPAVCLCVLAGTVALARRCRSTTGAAAVVAAVACAAVSALPEVNGGSDDPSRPAAVMAVRQLDRLIPPPQRAVVLVRYYAGEPVHDEPVYNWTAADPDDARIVVAHDLGPRDAELCRHYADTQPDRRAYLLDRADNRLTDLGPVAGVAARTRK